jgi:arsenate reductase
MVISSLRNTGFIIEVNNKNKENPLYTVSFSERMDPILCYSKKYDNSFDAGQMYVAVLNCPQAEATCPYIPPPVEKIALSYDDPAKYDSEQNALEAYKIACRQVATEMLWVMKKISGS